MTVLPIVGRELVVAARRAATYWTRFGAAALAVAVFLFLWLVDRGPTAELGSDLFYTLGIPTLGFCLLAGVFITADGLSAEKREGTLGLLFLTDLHGYDVVLGKLAANSMHAVFGLFAIFPVLALPLLTGGVSGGEFWRTVLVFVCTLYLSLSVGMFISSVSRDGRQSMAATFAILVMIAGILPLGWVFLAELHRRGPFPGAGVLLWPNPAYAYYKGIDAEYLRGYGARDFWRSLGIIALLATGCVAATSLILPRSWQNESAGEPARKSARRKFFSMLRKKRRRPALGDGAPFLWLAGGDFAGKSSLNLMVGGLILLWLMCAAMWVADKSNAFNGITIFLVFGVHLVAKIIIATESGRRFHLDRQSGAMELLLVTPLPVRDIVGGQKRALRAQFRRAIIAVCLTNFLFMILIYAMDPATQRNWQELVSLTEATIGGAVLLWLDAQALTWVGMWKGLKAKKYPRSVLATLAQVLVFPWVTIILFFFIEESSNVDISDGALDALFALWLLLGAVVDMVCILSARKKLLTRFRATVAQRYDG